jgi:uncharacterized repeat protein (TIGR01451 family)
VILNGALQVSMTDAAGDDRAEYDLVNGRLVFRLGSGASNSAGGQLQIGDSATVKFRVRVAESTLDGTVITSQATAAYTGLSTGAAISTSNQVASITVQRNADVSLTMMADTTTPAVNGEVLLTLTLTNNDSQPVGNVNVTRTLPAGLTAIAATPSQGTFNPTTGVWSAGTLAGASSATLVLRVQVTSTTPVTASAAITGHDRPDPNTGDDTTSVTLAPGSSDLSLSKTLSNPSPNVGDTITLTTTLTNNGPSAASTVRISDALPAGLTLVTATASVGAYTPGTGIWAIESLVTGASATLTLTATVAGSSATTPTASIQSALHRDPNTANNSASVTVTPRKVDLAVSQTADVTAPLAGQSIVLTTRVSNAGPSSASGVRLLVTIPAGLTIESVDAGSTTFTQGTGVWQVGSLASGSQAVLRITAKAATAAAKSISASLTAVDEFDTDTTNHAASVSVVPKVADLSVTQSLDTSSPRVDDTIVFTTRLASAGPDSASGVKVLETLAAGLEFISATATRGSFDPASGLWTVGTIARDETGIELRITARVKAAGALSAVAAIQAAGPFDPNAANNEATARTTALSNESDLSLSAALDTIRPNLGDEVEYALTVRTPGPTTATHVVVSITLPAGLQYVSDDGGEAAFSPATGTWNVGTVVPDTPITLRIRLKVVDAATQEVSAQVVGSDQPDPVADNNAATASLTVRSSDLALTSTVSQAAPGVGQEVEFNIQLTNIGPDGATNLVVVHSMPPAMMITGLDGPGTYNPLLGSWSLASLASGKSASLRIRAIALDAQERSITASIEASDQYDPTATNNDTSVTLTPRQANLSLALASSNPTPNVGDTVTLTFTLSNVGPDPATGVRTDTALPAGLVLNTATAASGSFSRADGAWQVPSLGAGESITLTILATVTGHDPLDVTAAIAQADTFDPGPADNSAAVVLTPRRADLALTAALDVARPNVGTHVVATYTLHNNGPDDANHVTVAITWPDGLAFEQALLDEPPAGMAFDPVTGLWTIPTLHGEGTAQLRLQLRVTDGVNQSIEAEVIGVDEADPTTTDRSASLTVDPLRADLSLTAVVDNLTPNRNDVMALTVTLRNDGPDAATGTAIPITVPAGYVYVDASDASYLSESGLWNVGEIAPGGSVAVVLYLRATSATVPPLRVGPITSETFDPSLAGNQATVTVTPQRAEVAVSKAVSNATPNVGDTITYTITVVNSGPGNATGVEIGDTLPAGISYVASTISGGIYDPLTGIWAVGTLAVGDEATLLLTATVTDISTTINHAVLTALDPFDTDPANDGAETSVTPQHAELRLTGVLDDNDPLIGDVVTIAYTLRNLGPSTTTGTLVTLVLPDGLELIDGTPGTGSGLFDPVTRVWTAEDLNSGDLRTLALRLRMTRRGTQTVIASAQADQFDPVTPDNVATTTVAAQESDLSLAFAISDTRPDANEPIVADLTLTNRGPNDATGVVVAITIPEGLELDGFDPPAGVYDLIADTWMPGALPAGQTITLRLHLRSIVPGPKSLLAAVTSLDQADPVADDNAIAVVILPRQANLNLVLTADDDHPDVNQTIALTVVLTNYGPDTATGIQVADALPPGLLLDSAFPTRGSFDPQNGVWTLPTLASGASATLTLYARVVTPTTTIHSASVTTLDPFDTDASDDADSVEIIPTQADLVTAITVDTARPNIGDTITLTLSVTNTGPDDASGLVLSHALPAGLEWLTAVAPQAQTSGASGRWIVGDLPAGATRTVTVQARVKAVGILTTTLGVTGTSTYDPNPDSNASTLNVDSQRLPLTLTQTLDDGTPDSDQVVTIIVSVANPGPEAASGLTVSWPLDAGLALVSTSPSAGSFDPSTGLWMITDLAGGASEQFVLRARVIGASPITARAAIVAAEPYDPVVVAPVESILTPNRADIALAYAFDRPRAGDGDTVWLTLTATNHGPDPATGLVVAAPLPAGLTFLSSRPGAGASYDPATGLWTLPALASVASATLRVEARVRVDSGLDAAAHIAALGPFDSDPANNHAGARLDPLRANLAVHVERIGSTGDTAVVGQEVLLRVVVTNNGPDAARNVRLPIVVPPGMSLVASDPEAGTFDPDTGIWPPGTLDPGASRAITFRLVPLATGDLELNVGPVTSTAVDDGRDDDSATSAWNALPAQRASIIGVAFDDTDHDTVLDPGETLRSGLTVVLEGTDVIGRPVRRETTTGPDGSYRFDTLPAGTYAISVPSLTAAHGVAGTAGGVGEPTGRVTGIALADGAVATGYAFAAIPSNLATGQLTGRIFVDMNRNGRYDAPATLVTASGRRRTLHDVGVATLRVTLTGVDDLGQSVRRETLTTATGQYVFDGLRPGTYSIGDERSKLFRSLRASVGTAGGVTVGKERVDAIPLAGLRTVGDGYDFAKTAWPGCQLNTLVLNPSRILPRGPLIRRYFPSLVAAALANRSS